MSWRRSEPEGRVFALVLPVGYDIPFIGQFEPRLGRWVSPGLKWYYPSDCEWHPLPFHKKFNPKTHAVTGGES